MSKNEENAKQKIINAAVELLSKEPLEKITMRRIAKESKVTLSSINYYFQTIENLIRELKNTKILRKFALKINLYMELEI